MKMLRKMKQFLFRRKVYRTISKSELFDKDWYMKQYPEIRQGSDPIKHYLKKGWKEGKEPSKWFHSSKYLCAYPNVWNEGRSPLEYYLFCRDEKRMCFCVNQRDVEKPTKTNQTPLVSVIIASYNYEQLLPEAIDSILKQTYTNYEIIIVDDGSTDNSINVINKYLSANKNISLYRHPNNENTGLPNTVRLGIENSRGEFIAFCESDDVWHPQYLEKKVDIINKYQDVKIISNNVELFGNREIIQLRRKYVEGINSFLFEGGNDIDLSDNYIPTFSAVMIRKDIVQNLNYDAPIPAWIDFWLYRQILSHTYLYYTSEKLTFWRMHHESFNNVKLVKSYDEKRNLFMFCSDRLNGVKMSRQILNKISVLEKSKYFDVSYYLRQYGSELEGLEPVIHYLFWGWKKGYNPSLLFYNNAYLNDYADVYSCHINPLIHYELYGKKERRKIVPVGFVEKYQIQESDVEFINRSNKDTKTVLLISHELSLTGAPRALLNMAIILKKTGATPVILSLKPGPMEKEITDLGIKLLVEPLLELKGRLRDQLLFHFFSEFQTIVFNTLETVRYVEHFSHIATKKICWLHEGRYSYYYWPENLNLSALFSHFDKVYAVGAYSKSFATSYIEDEEKLGILLYGIPDIKISFVNKITDNKINFLLPGSLTERKGQLVLLKSLALLSKEVRKQIRIYIAGAALERKVEKAIKRCHYSCINYLGELEHEQLMYLFSDMHVILTPSLDDPMPIVCTEAMILEKTIIVSKNTGTASFIEDGINGYKISVDDPLALAGAIKEVVENRKQLPALGKAARRIYDENFTMEIFERNIKALIVENSWSRI